MDHDSIADPQPAFATADEIALAERLRRKIEERYLGERNENGRSPEELQPLMRAA